MSAFDRLIRSAKQSQQTLMELLCYCERDLHEDPNSPAMPHWGGEFQLTQDSRTPWIVPSGISLELWGEQPQQLWRFACIQARNAQRKGGVVVLVDPFGEFEELRDDLPILDMDATLILRETEPLKLAMALIRLLGRLLVDVGGRRAGRHRTTGAFRWQSPDGTQPATRRVSASAAFGFLALPSARMQPAAIAENPPRPRTDAFRL